MLMRYYFVLGVGMIKRKMAASAKPNLTISKDGETWTIEAKAGQTMTQTFKLNEEFDHVDGSGRKSKVRRN